MDKKDLKECPEMDYFMNESVSDVVFVIDGHRMPANRLYLSFKSKVFRDMFSDKFKESKEVVIEDTTFEAFKTLIQFLYSGQLDLKKGNDIKLLDGVYKLSDRYEVNRLLKKLAKHMKTIPLTLENIGLASKLSISSKNKELKDKVMSFIDYNLNKFIRKDMNQLIAINDFTHNHLLEDFTNKLMFYKRGICKECDEHYDFTPNTTYPRCYDCKKQL